MGCMDFRRPLKHQPLKVVDGGGALVFTDKEGKDLSDEILKVTGVWVVVWAFMI